MPNADAFLTPGADIIQDGSTRSVGKIVAVCDDVALVLVRLKAALQSAGGETPLLVAGSNTIVKPWFPPWWPEDWKVEAAQLSAARA